MEPHFETINISVGKSNMQSTVAYPPEGGEHPGIILFQEAFGVNGHIRDVVGRVAALGFVVVAPEVYHRTADAGAVFSYSDKEAVAPHREALTDDLLTDDIQAAYHWLQNSPRVKKGKTGVIGFCMGGRASFLANTVLPVSAAVSFYGGGIAPNLLPRSKDSSAPIMLFWGGTDAHIDSEQRRSVSDALDEADKPYVEVVFSDVGHAFFNDTRSDSYDADAAVQAWALTKTFLELHLGA